MARRAQLTLLSNAAATGQAFDWPGGQGGFYVTAAFGGGTVKLQTLGPDGNWYDVGTEVTLTNAGSASLLGGFNLPAGQIRANVSAATGVYAYAVGIPANIGG